MEFSCRAPEPTDLEYVYALENNAEHWSASDIHQPLSKEVLKQWLFNGVDVYASKHLRMMICKKGENIGCLDLLDIDFYHQHAHVAIIVEKQYRGIGAARFALDHAGNYAKKSLDLLNLFAEVQQENNESHRLFSSSGFDVIGTRKNARKGLSGFSDIHIYQKAL